MKYFFVFLSLASLAMAEKPDGAQLFTMNCSACHLPDQMVVGPSLAEIRTLYLGKLDDFVKWCVAPQKKRPNAVDMPSMVHVGDEGLRLIHEHIMKVSVGVKKVGRRRVIRMQGLRCKRSARRSNGFLCRMPAQRR